MALIRLRVDLGDGAPHLTPKAIHGAISAMLRGDPLADAAHAGERPPVFSPWLDGHTLRIGLLADAPATCVWRHLEGGPFPSVPAVGVRGVCVEAGAPWATLVPPSESRLPTYFDLTLATPLSFRHAGADLPLPLPDLILGSLARSWRAYADMPLPAEVESGVVHLVEVRGESVVHRLGAPVLWRTGFVGHARIRVDPGPAHTAACALLALTPYTGVGQKAAWGMGRALVEGAPDASAETPYLGQRKGDERRVIW